MAKSSAVAEPASKSEQVREYLADNPAASVPVIVAAFQARGIEISTALAGKIKYSDGGKKKKGGRKKSARASGVNGRARGAKRRSPRGEKADAIRAAFGKLGRRARPRDVIALLSEQGVRVTSSQVVTIRKALRRRRGVAKVKAAVVAAPVSHDAISLEHLLEAKRMAEKVGGIEAAQRAVATLAKLT